MAAFLATASMTVCISGNSICANTTDTDITDFSAAPSISNTFTPLDTKQQGIRVKENSSSVYLNITSTTYDLRVQTWGLSDTSWKCSKQMNCTYNSSGKSTAYVSVNSYYRYEIYNQIKKIDNKVYNYPCAGLKFSSTNNYNWSTVRGKWSPDYDKDYSSDMRIATN